MFKALNKLLIKKPGNIVLNCLVLMRLKDKIPIYKDSVVIFAKLVKMKVIDNKVYILLFLNDEQYLVFSASGTFSDFKIANFQKQFESYIKQKKIASKKYKIDKEKFIAMKILKRDNIFRAISQREVSFLKSF